MAKRIAQRIASRAIRRKIASMMAPAMMVMVVNVIRCGCQLSVVRLSYQLFGIRRATNPAFCLLLLPTAYCLL